MIARAWSVIRQDLGPILAVSCALLPIGVAMMPCLVGVPVLAYALARLTVMLLGAARRRIGTAPRTSVTAWTGAYALAGLVILVSSMATGAWVSLELFARQGVIVRYGSALAAALIASVVVGAALAPFAFAPFVRADGAPGVVRPLTRSFELAARLGPRRMLTLGATAGRWLGVSLIGVATIFVFTTPDAALVGMFLAAPFGVIVGAPLSGALLADAYVEASAMPERGVAAPASVRLRGIALVLAPAVAAMLVAVLIAALTPTPMREVAMQEPIRRGLHGFGITAEPQRRSLPGDVLVSTAEHGVRIEASDGGGAGEVDARFETTESALFLERGETYGGEPGTYAVIVTSGEEWAVTIVDADGVRQDDAITRRVLGRLGRVGSAALGIGMLLLLVLAWRIGVDLGEARALDVPDLRETGRGVLSALEGTLRLGEGARLRRLRRGLDDAWIVEGDAWLEADGGALRFKIPEGRLPALGATEEARDGSTLVLLSRFARVAPSGLRTASTPWPEDARLVIGARADAASALVERATRVASWIALPAVVAIGAAAVVLLTSL